MYLNIYIYIYIVGWELAVADTPIGHDTRCLKFLPSKKSGVWALRRSGDRGPAHGHHTSSGLLHLSLIKR